MANKVKTAGASDTNGKVNSSSSDHVNEKNGTSLTVNSVDAMDLTDIEGKPVKDKEDPTAAVDNAGKTKNPKVEQRRVGFFELFRFADGLDVLLMIVGSICAMAVGASFPTNVYFFGDMITQFVVNQQSMSLNQSTIYTIVTSTDTRYHCYKTAIFKKIPQLATASNVTGAYLEMLAMSANATTTPMASTTVAQNLFDVVVNRYVAAFCGIAVGVLICGYLGMSLWVLTAERQVRKVRFAFFNSVMRQDIGWFDTHQSGELNTRMVDDVNRLHEGFGDKMATFLQWTSTFIGGFIIGFVQGWKLALVIMSTTPILVVAAAVMGRVVRSFVQKELQAYAKAGAVATEVLTAIRTVTAFGGQAKAIKKYQDNLGNARREGVKKTAITGVTGGIIWFVIFSAFALAYWYGGKLVREECLDPGVILQVFFGVLIGSMSLGQAAPLLENFSNARGAAAVLFEIIDTPSKIDSSSEAGQKPNVLRGDIEYENINFAYPARQDVQVMKGLSLKIKAGNTVALVGPSGCGKSTLIQLLQRFYDPQQGTVKVDGIDIKDLNLHWLRGHTGVVGQEPVLFATTIEDNIKLGGTDVTDADVERAAKEANCYDFISKLPLKFKTLVGERGAQLSGGQKQRIAIARAIVGNPRILLLDEATSALDTESEAVVQAALDKASEGRTTIIVAHRLSTVRNANTIFALRNGIVVEAGTHTELMDRKGLYYSLNVQQQAIAEKEKQEASKVEDEDGDVEAFIARQVNVSAHNSESNTSEAPEQKFTRTLSSSTQSKRQRTFSSKDEEAAEFARHDPFRASLRSLRDATPALLRVTSFDPDDPDKSREELTEDAAATDSREVPMSRIFRLNMPEIVYIILGSIGALLSGVVQPSFAIIMSEIFGVFGFTLDPDEQERQIAFWAGMMVVIGASSAIVTVLQSTMFAVSGERLTERLRLQSFTTMLQQEIGWFDDQRNQVGALTAQLAMDASSVKGATGARAGIIIQSASNVVVALVISFVYVWQLTLVIMLFFPLTIAGGVVQGRLLQGYAVGDKVAAEQGGMIAQEVVSNIRTVAGLNKEAYFISKFTGHFDKLYKRDRMKAFLYGIAYGSSQCIVFFCYAVCFSFGAYLVDTIDVKFFYILRVFSAITFGGMAIGRATASAPDFSKAKVSANKLFALFDRKSEIDPFDASGVQLQDCKGNVKFTDVAFRYPTRPTVPILRNLSVEVSQGERLALVGSSGCGKSTAVLLLERFYDPEGGFVHVDGHELKSINVQSLRKQLGIVSQEPILFDTTIAENIAYGDNTREVPMEEIMEAARKANIHDFITKLPLAYDTNVGDKGTQLSGGQKQRVAIARALVRNPRILLLDEATSALDTESEKVVQEALNKAQEGRTCIVIAHRLSTVRNANKIAVIYRGKIAEIGTHDELIAAKKHYYKLVNAQLA